MWLGLGLEGDRCIRVIPRQFPSQTSLHRLDVAPLKYRGNGQKDGSLFSRRFRIWRMFERFWNFSPFIFLKVNVFVIKICFEVHYRYSIITYIMNQKSVSKVHISLKRTHLTFYDSIMSFPYL